MRGDLTSEEDVRRVVTLYMLEGADAPVVLWC